MRSMMQALTGVKLYSQNSFPLLQILPKVSLASCCYLWGYMLIMIVKLIEQGLVVHVIPTGSMIKGSKNFYSILLKEDNLYFLV